MAVSFCTLAFPAIRRVPTFRCFGILGWTAWSGLDTKAQTQPATPKPKSLRCIQPYFRSVAGGLIHHQESAKVASRKLFVGIE